MIFGETGGSKTHGPNINNDRVVPFSNSRSYGDKIVIKDVLKKKPNLKERIRDRLSKNKNTETATSIAQKVAPKKSKIKVALPNTKKQSAPNLAKVLESVAATASLSSTTEKKPKSRLGKITNITVQVPTGLEKVKPIDLFTPEEEKDVSKYLSEILTTPISKKKSKKPTRLAILAGELENAKTKEEQEALELEQLRKQLHAKFSAVAAEEGVDMVFDVDAALSKFAKPAIKKKKKKTAQAYKKTVQTEKAIDTVDTLDIVPKTKIKVVEEDDSADEALVSRKSSYVAIDIPQKPKPKKRRIIAQRKLGNQYVSIGPNSVPDKLDAEALASNVVDIREKEIVEFRKSTNALTRQYIDFMRRDILPHLIALDSAIDYTQALMQDGLSREDLTTDDSLLITLRWMLHRKATEFFGKTLNCTMSGDHFDQVISELYKTDLLKSVTYSSDTVGVVRKKTDSVLGVVAQKSTKRRQQNED